MKRKKTCQSCCLAVGEGTPPPLAKIPGSANGILGPCLVFVSEIRYAFLVMPGSCGHHRRSIHHMNDNSRFYRFIIDLGKAKLPRILIKSNLPGRICFILGFEK